MVGEIEEEAEAEDNTETDIVIDSMLTELDTAPEDQIAKGGAKSTKNTTSATAAAINDSESDTESDDSTTSSEYLNAVLEKLEDEYDEDIDCILKGVDSNGTLFAVTPPVHAAVRSRAKLQHQLLTYNTTATASV